MTDFTVPASAVRRLLSTVANTNNGEVWRQEMNKWMTIGEVCGELGVTRSTLDKWRVKGRAPKSRRLPNGSLRFSRAELEMWIDALPTAA